MNKQTPKTKPKAVAKASTKATPKNKPAPAAPVVRIAAPAGGTSAPTPGSLAAYQTWLPVAQAIPMAKVLPYRGSPDLQLANLQIGLAAVAPYLAQLALLPSPFDINVLGQLVGIGLGLVYAAAQVDVSSTGTVAQLRTAVAASRTRLLSAALALVASGLLPAAEVQRIQRGVGSRDNAQDCIDLAQLFTANATAIAGRSAITADDIATASSVGDQLLAALSPTGVRTQPLNVANPAAAIRDQFATLLATQYEHLLRAGLWIWQLDVHDHVPPLSERAVHKKKAPKAPATPT